MTDRLLLKYQKVRQIVNDGKNKDRAREIAEEHGLPASMQDMTVTAIEDWPSRDPKFYEVMSGVFEDDDAPAIARALAAENASSYCSVKDDVPGTKLWSDRALMLVPELGEVDGKLLTAKVNAGLYDRGLLELEPDGLRGIISYMIEVGGFDAPGRVKAWLEHFELAEQISWLERVTALNTDETAANIYYMGWCENKLTGLRG